MTIKTKAIVVAISTSLGLSLAATSIHAATLTSLVITSGTFQMGVFTPLPQILTANGANLVAGAIAPTFDTTISQTSAAASSPIAFDFNSGGTWMNSFTTAAASGDETGGVMSGTINLSMNWHTATSAQGGTFTGTGDGSNFSISWTSIWIGGPFQGQTTTYNVSGTYAVEAVPIPAAAWLMGSGLVGLVGVAGRKK